MRLPVGTMRKPPEVPVRANTAERRGEETVPSSLRSTPFSLSHYESRRRRAPIGRESCQSRVPGGPKPAPDVSMPHEQLKLTLTLH